MHLAGLKIIIALENIQSQKSKKIGTIFEYRELTTTTVNQIILAII